MDSKSARLHKLHAAGGLSGKELASIAQHAQSLGGLDLKELETTIRLDVESEFDARFLAEHLCSQPWSLSIHLKAALEQWLVEEALHERLFFQVYQAAFPDSLQGLRADLLQRQHAVLFEPLAHLMRDEFEVLCLLAYDELTTVKAYQALLPEYLKLGPTMATVLHLVVRDEGRHYATFAQILREQYPHRLHEAEAQIERIRTAEGTPYANTFVLDHDADAWTESIFDRSAAQLKRALTSV